MLDNINEILNKYSTSTLNNLNKDNIEKIIIFLKKEKCDCIEDIIENYIDIFTLDFDEFEKKYKKLNDKYNNNYLNLVEEDMNYLEELFYDI